MADLTPEWQSHADFLTRLGFPRPVVAETIHALESGLLEPSPELVQKTIDACRRAAASRPRAAWVVDGAASEPRDMAAYEMMVSRVIAMAREGGARPALSSVGRLVGECLLTVGLVNTTWERPMMVLDNHNVVVPRWWSSDTGFIAVRDTLRSVNEAAFEVHASPAIVVMVLRPTFGAYEDVDFRSLSSAFSERSDIWLMPYEMAGRFKDQGALVFGDGRAMTLGERYDTPGAAFSAFREVVGETAGDIRTTIVSMTTEILATRRRTEIRTQSGDDTPLRALFRHVIETCRAVRVMD